MSDTFTSIAAGLILIAAVAGGIGLLFLGFWWLGTLNTRADKRMQARKDQRHQEHHPASFVQQAATSSPAGSKPAEAPAVKPEAAKPLTAPQEAPPDPFTEKIKKNVCFLLKTESNRETYAYDRTADTFYELKYQGSEYGRPVRQEEMPLCYYIITDNKEGIFLCLFGTGETDQLEHLVPDHDSFPPGPAIPEFAWGDFDRKPAKLYVFSDGVRLVWRWLTDLNAAAVRQPSAEFPKLADAISKKNREPYEALQRLIDRQRALLETEGMKAFARWTPDTSYFTLKRLDMILYDISGFSAERLSNENAAEVLDLELQIMQRVTPTLRLARKNVLLADPGNRDIHALARLMKDKCPGFALTDRDNFRCMWDGDPDFEHNDKPKFYWRDILTGKCFVTYERYEGWSYNGDEDYLSVFCAPCSQEEFDAALRSGDARPGP